MDKSHFRDGDTRMLPDNADDAAEELVALTALALAATESDRPPVAEADLREGLLTALLRIHALALVVRERLNEEPSAALAA